MTIRPLAKTVLAAVFCLMLAGCEEAATETQEIIPPVKAMKVSAQESFTGRKFPGRAKASQEVTLAFEVPGKLAEFPVDVGDEMKKGEKLAMLDRRDFQNALTAARAELKRSKAQYERVKKAAAVNAVSQQDLTDAQAVYQAAQADVGIKAKALEDSTLTAPYDATVVATYVENFENIRPKQPVVRLLNPDQIEMVVDIPEDLISRAEKIKKTDGINVTFDAFPGKIIPANIKEIGKEASTTTRTYPVTLTMKQPEGIKILPGMAGEAWSNVNPQDIGEIHPAAGQIGGFEVPVTAIFDDGEGGKFVWVIDEESGVVAKTAVTTGNITRKGVLVKEGLQGGEYIARAGVNMLQEGQQVRIIE